jgi:hypothetical protein
VPAQRIDAQDGEQRKLRQERVYVQEPLV